jgi:hypothetical protein
MAADGQQPGPAARLLQRMRDRYPRAALVVIVMLIALTMLAGPFGQTGFEVGLAALAFTLALGVLVLRPRPILYVPALATLGLAFVAAELAPRGLFNGVLFSVLIAAAWIGLWASAGRWWLGPTTYVAVGLWLLWMTAIREGPDHLFRAFLDVDQLVFAVLVPLFLWPYVVLGMLGLFGIVFS